MENKKVVVALKYFKGELNPFDSSALENALLCGYDITVVAMAPLSVKQNLLALTRLGVKAVLISDLAYAGSDTVATSLVLATAIERLNPDYVFCGRQSVDGDTAQVPPMLAQRLGYELVAGVMGIDGDKLLYRVGSGELPSAKAVITFEKSKTLRFPSIFSKASEVQVFTNEHLNLHKDKIGLNGSTTKVVKSYESSVGRRFCEFVDADKLSQLIEKALSKKNPTSNIEIENKLDIIYYVGDVKGLAESLAKVAVNIDVNGRSAQDVADYIIKNDVKTVIFEDLIELKILASKVAVIVNAGLCADCISFANVNGNFVMTRPALGGTVTADIVSTGKVAMATVKTAKNTGAKVLFSIGKGAEQYIEKISELAKKYNAELACSRIVADSNKLPYNMQVGLTGKTVCPSVYVAFGISGAVQHTCAISGADTVIAINNDKNARIFDYSDYGVYDDVKNVIEHL